MTSSQLVKMRLELRRGVLVLAVLGLLKQAHYGYSLRKQLQEGGIDIDEGTLYPLVRRLADQGLLESEWRQAEGRERRYYQLSSLGAELLSQLTDEWQQLNGALAFLLGQSADTNGTDTTSSDKNSDTSQKEI
ncbi:transcriptional regulator, PadR family [Shewanella sp. W3-18-1]|uniref:PadR family transcriptional regulator n=1 Tax=Shewanella sp. (strain W3-18-1) TaxID=351745 RepID=UPI00005FDA8A|nr:PadR family transcriptional regulator [Shewanella sp. W3-18-1]ABM26292.1 transcriptional regulator, PadR family [Shewanella sp. W3-18-1]